jgi:DNA-directed RNA polymerase sigma subunit (sigma70/sigma32)
MVPNMNKPEYQEWLDAHHERRKHILKAIAIHKNFSHVGKLFNISRERVRQIAAANGHKTGAYLANKAKRDQRIKAAHATGKTMAEVAAQFRISEGRVWQIVRDYVK